MISSCPEAVGWDSWWFWKKAVSWDTNLGEASPVVGYGMRGAFFWGQRAEVLTLGRTVQLGAWPQDDVGTVRIVKIVSLSLLVSKT